MENRKGALPDRSEPRLQPKQPGRGEQAAPDSLPMPHELRPPPVDLAARTEGPTRARQHVEARAELAEPGPAEPTPAEARRLAETILDHTHMMAVYLDRQFSFIWVNQAYAAACRHDPSFFPGRNHFDLYPDKENQAIFQRVVDTGKPFFADARAFEFPDQPERGVTYWDWSLIPVKDPHGEVTGLVFSLAEVTGRVRAEEALRESEERYRTLFENMAEASCLDEVVYRDGKVVDYRIIDINPAFERIAGISRSRAAGALASDLYGPGEIPFLDTYARVAKTGVSAHFEAFFPPLGKYLSITASCPRKGRFSTVFSDITQRKLAEDHRQLAIEVLEILARPNQMADVIQDLLHVIKAATGVEAVGLRLREGEEYPYYVQNGFPDHFVRKEISLCARGPDGAVRRDADGKAVLECMCGNVLRGKTDPTRPYFTEGGSFWTNSTTQLLASTTDDDRGAHARNYCNVAGYESVALIPLRSGEEILGLLQLNDHRTGRFTDEMIRFFEGMATSIGIAVARRRAAAELAESERRSAALAARNSAILAAVPDIIMEVNTDKVYTWANQAGLEFFGPDVIGKEASAYFVGEQDTYARVEPLCRGEDDTIYVESLQHRRDGRPRLLAWWCRALKDGEGNVTGSLSTARDITDLRQKEQERERLVAILEATSDYVGFVDADTLRLRYANQAGRRMVGFGPDEDITNTRVPDIHPAWANRMHEETILPIARRDGIWSGECAFLHRDGHEIPVLMVTLSHKDSSGQVKYFSTISRDITELRQTEAQLRQSQKMEAIGQLAGGVAHDFRNQLTVIIGFSEMLLRRSLVTEEGVDKVHEILKAADRSALLTGQLLAFSRKQTLEPRRLDLTELVADISKAVPHLIGEDIRVHIRPCSTPCVVEIDAGQFQQALLNLVTNARDAMPRGGELTIRTSREELDEGFLRAHPDARPGVYAAVTVADTGCGMDEATRARLFEPFFTTKEVGQGTGLGLSMVYGFVTQSGGIIEVDSRSGEGSTFTMYFPERKASRQADTKDAGARRLPGGTETILVVEDEESVRQMLVESLRESGYTVIQAGNAAEALARIDQADGGIDLLITDVVMPGSSGVDLVQGLARTHPHLPTLSMSGYPEKELARRGVTMAPGKMLAKPCTHDMLLARARQLLDEAKAENEPPRPPAGR